jgi:predicted nucleic acid-binding Zn ribbon protein
MKRIKSEPEKLGLALGRVLKKYGAEKKILEQSLMQNWDRLVGEKIAQQTQPLKVENKKLFLKVPSPVWRNELLYLKPELIKKLNIFAKTTLIQDIIFLN